MTRKFAILVTFSCATILFAPTRTFAQEAARNDATRIAIQPTITQIEAVMLGKKHKPLEEFVAADAIFEESESPLVDYLERVIARTTADGERTYPAQSQLFWTMLPESPLLPMFKRYRRLDPKQAVLVFRELDRSNGRLKAIGYVLQRFDGKWKVVFGFEGTGPEDQLSKNAVPFKTDA